MKPNVELAGLALALGLTGCTAVPKAIQSEPTSVPTPEYNIGLGSQFLDVVANFPGLSGTEIREYIISPADDSPEIKVFASPSIHVNANIMKGIFSYYQELADRGKVLTMTGMDGSESHSALRPSFSNYRSKKLAIATSLEPAAFAYETPFGFVDRPLSKVVLGLIQRKLTGNNEDDEKLIFHNTALLACYMTLQLQPLNGPFEGEDLTRMACESYSFAFSIRSQGRSYEDYRNLVRTGIKTSGMYGNDNLMMYDIGDDEFNRMPVLPPAVDIVNPNL